MADESLKRAIDRLRGEWTTLTDGTIETTALAEEADLVAAAAEVDLIVFPSRSLGELCEAQAIRPLRQSVVESEDLRFQDFLPLVRDQEIVYATQPMALPLGCPSPLMLAPEGSGGFQPPEDDVELALAYLAWAAPYAAHRSRLATLFDADTFAPRFTKPPFVRALQSFVDASAEGAATFCWPRREEQLDPSSGQRPTPLPGSDEVFNTLAGEWEQADKGDEKATLIASRGRLIAVTQASRNAATAFRYAAWLAGPDNAREVSTASDNVANCRGSFARSGDAWRASNDRDSARAFAAATAEALRQSRYLITPRLPGADEYLFRLANHVRDAVEGRPAQEALTEASADWEEITDRRGREAQHAAYLRSINARRF